MAAPLVDNGRGGQRGGYDDPGYAAGRRSDLYVRANRDDHQRGIPPASAGIVRHVNDSRGGLTKMARRALCMSKEQFWYVVCIIHPEMTRDEFEHMWDENYRKRRPQ